MAEFEKIKVTPDMYQLLIEHTVTGLVSMFENGDIHSVNINNMFKIMRESVPNGNDYEKFSFHFYDLECRVTFHYEIVVIDNAFFPPHIKTAEFTAMNVAERTLPEFVKKVEVTK
ncbi:hypothetical protein CKN86_11875 [Carnobacterium divergens]|uniref:hypothetical protein n=1 Tax=Carnobacterium divergens TaxID=2748 RepID=UPI000D20FADD|nr:hypothetical protein [Carnobacterium divergens]MCO6017464.1 hypothetical protein [Carnobacterium divergens]TFI61104.1 hypothetical protein CKN62_12015 [Carnobacterium divergens]TFI88126.1 hypothetical protein CKN84_11905 [Carnobacterium divergens]TFJ02694.1 hypothetical protein CKN86_11875 [Carnobacterium divergens]TFJ04204.1 hypothetical protein CKN65_11915 [Carnobacterium divergens]